MIIYKTTNLVNTKIYVGRDAANDPKYLGSGALLKKAILKYGRENFKKEILEYCTKENIYEREQCWIALLKATNPLVGYNICPGGEGFLIGNTINVGRRHKLETLRKLREANLGERSPSFGRKASAATRQAMSLAHQGEKHFMFGKHWSPTTKAKISLHHMGKTVSEDTKKKISAKTLGRAVSATTRAKISEAQRGEKGNMFGKTLSEEVRLKISASERGEKNHFYGKKHSEATKEQLRYMAKQRWVAHANNG